MQVIDLYRYSKNPIKVWIFQISILWFLLNFASLKKNNWHDMIKYYGIILFFANLENTLRNQIIVSLRHSNLERFGNWGSLFCVKSLPWSGCDLYCPWQRLCTNSGAHLGIRIYCSSNSLLASQIHYSEQGGPNRYKSINQKVWSTKAKAICKLMDVETSSKSIPTAKIL